MPPRTQVKPKTVSLTILPLTRTLQFYWFLGHVLSVFCFLLSLLFGVFSSRKSLTYYRLTLFFELVSYSIVAKQVHFKTRTFNRGHVLKDENVQYLIFAVVLLMSSFIVGPLSGSLYSYAIFSFFHSLTYFQSNLLEALPLSLGSQSAISTRISFITTNYNQQALFFASAGEVMILSSFLWSVPGLIFQIFSHPLVVAVKLLTFVATVVFVKLRYNDSQFTKAVVQQFDQRIGAFLTHPAVPSNISRLYNVTFKDFVNRYISPIKAPTLTSEKKTQ